MQTNPDQEMKYLLENEETERLIFKKIDPFDFHAWIEFFKDPSSFEYWEVELESPEIECENWYKKQLGRYDKDQGGMNALIEKQTGKLVGHCGLLIQKVDGRTELEIAYSLLGNGRKKGYATEAVIKCRDHAFENSYAESLISIISLPNIPSANVAIKAGMKVVRQTVYNRNPVNIFRIHKRDWLSLKRSIDN